MWRRNETEPLSIGVIPQSPLSTGIATALAKTALCLSGRTVGEINESIQKKTTKTNKLIYTHTHTHTHTHTMYDKYGHK